MDVKLIIGLEIHVELDTASKMFCACSTSFAAPPNSNVCPVCMGMPGTLPTMNALAYEYSVRAGIALNCTIARYTKWDRKNYYYPDLPKNYQISQYDLPLAENGSFEYELDGETKRVRIIRAHLEEDAGKLLHEGLAGYTQVDLNRAGTPLLEIVTEPDFRSADEVGSFARELRNTLRYLAVSHCDMQKGQMRFEPNINLHITADDGKVYKTPICEVKNLNSFRALEGAIAYESRRQLAEWETSGVTMATGNKVNRGWDDKKGHTVPQREKEEAHDYRYLPDPDLIPVELSDERLEEIRGSIGEMPIDRRRRFTTELGLDAKDATALVEDKHLADYFDAAAAKSKPEPTAKWVLNEVTAHCNEHDVRVADFPITPHRLAALVILAESGEVSKAQGREIFTEMLTSEKDPVEIQQAKGFDQITDESALESVIETILAANPKAVEAVKAGKHQAIGPMIGHVKKQEPNANPKLVREMLLRRIQGM